MYGTTMKHYGANRASGIKDAKKNLFSKKTTKKSKKDEDTRYLNLDSSNDVDAVEYAETVESDRNAFSKRDFPIPSVIATVLMTMMLLVVAVGLLGV